MPGPSAQDALQDHTYAVTKNVKPQLDETIERLGKVQKEKEKRREKNIDKFYHLLSQLKEENLISSSAEEDLGKMFSGCTKDLIERMVSNDGKGKTYRDELKSLAMTHHFYSILF